MELINISRFKATCLSLLDLVSKTGRSITVTRNGKPLVVIYPANQHPERPKFGCAKGSAIIHADLVDFETEKEWEALS